MKKILILALLINTSMYPVNPDSSTEEMAKNSNTLDQIIKRLELDESTRGNKPFFTYGNKRKDTSDSFTKEMNKHSEALNRMIERSSPESNSFFTHGNKNQAIAKAKNERPEFARLIKNFDTLPLNFTTPIVDDTSKRITIPDQATEERNYFYDKTKLNDDDLRRYNEQYEKFIQAHNEALNQEKSKAEGWDFIGER